MRRKVESLAEGITEVLSSWETVECVTLGEQSETDTLDPYFALVIDAYCLGEVPPAERRREAFSKALGDPGAFESSNARLKDRFLIKSLPVRVEYKSVALLDAMSSADRGDDPVWMLENSGTYPLYRLLESRVLFRRSDWIDRIRESLGAIPDGFWKDLRDAFEAKMDHYLGDLGAAAMRDDAYFYCVSEAGFARYAAAALFIANRRFEPSARSAEEQLLALPLLPDAFRGRWEILLRADISISRAQKHEIAELIARSIIALR